MSTTVLPQVDPTSLDTTGLSIATSYIEDNPRSGTIYDSSIVAAVAPLWFHPMPDGTHLMVMARRWHTATLGSAPGIYSAHTEDLTPSWAVVDGPRGNRSQVSGSGITIPLNTTLTDPEPPLLVGAASRAPDHLYLLYTTELTAVLQRIRLSPTGSVSIAVEETLPTLAVEGEDDPVVFDMGLQMSTPHLYVYGTDSDNKVYRARKPWALLGSIRSSATSPAPAWEYFTGTGYSTDPTEAVPMEDLTTVAPMGFGAVRATTVMTTVTKTGDDFTGHFWASTKGRPLRKLSTTVPLGDDDTFLGHGLRPQPELAPLPANAGSPLALTYLWTTLSVLEAEEEEDNEFSLINTWDLLPIS